ncbi:oxidoreductase [Salinicola endophyticus]|uniref:Oxidoreductase n=1 Tax=Salinicola endophyticus TaxID=1949083 RepID=A0AB74U9J5_9GAMM
MAKKIWFVTGASRGFGRIWSEAALKRGDHVVATARKLDDVADLSATYGDAVLPLALDVNDRDAVFAAMKQGHEHFGRIDVVINNAGYGQFGTIEEVAEKEARAQFETNVFGAIWVLQAALPIMREQKSGHLLTVTSIGGLVSLPTVGVYNASKFAMEGINDALVQEVKDFGIKVTMIEPSGYATDWAGPSAHRADSIAAYDGVRDDFVASLSGMKRGDPNATADAILKVVDADEPPLRFMLGSFGLGMVKKSYEQRIAEWEAWYPVSAAAE